MTDDDWNIILPLLQENERLFGVSVDGFLLMKDGKEARPNEVYRKIEPSTAKGKPEDILDDDI